MEATRKIGLACVAAAGLFAASANAAVVYSGSSGNLAASASFSLSGSTLTVVLTNTSSNDVLVPADVLTAVFFNSSGMTPVSASLNGSTVFFGPNGGGNVGGEWAYGSGLSGAPGSMTSGISSTGVGLFGNPNFNGANLQGPLALDGLQYGITSAGDNTATGNAAVTGGFALIKNSVTFVLTVPNGFTLASLGNTVWFLYGTALTEPTFTGDCGRTCTPPDVPEPGTLALLGLGLMGLGISRSRKTA